MSNPIKQPRHIVPGHPGIYRRGTRYQVRHRDRQTGKVVSRTFDTLPEAAEYKESIEPRRGELWSLHDTDELIDRLSAHLAQNGRPMDRDAIIHLAVVELHTREGLDRR